MRFVEVAPKSARTAGDGGVLRLHPRLTVVQAKADDRLRLLQTIKDTLRGQPAGAGLINCRGLLLDFDAETLKLLSLAADTPMIVESGDLPLPPPSPARVRRDGLEHQLTELDRAMADAVNALNDAIGARIKAEADLQAARAEIEAALAAQAQADEAAVDEPASSASAISPLALASADPSTIGEARRARVNARLAEALDAHGEAVRALHRMASSPEGTAVAHPAAMDDATRDGLLARRAELVERLSTIELIDVEQVRAAADAYETAARRVGAADPRRATLLEQWRDVTARLAALPPATTRPNPQLIAMAKARVRAAERALDEARTAARSLRDPAVRLAIERAHDAVEKAEAAASKSRSRATAREKYDQARQHEAALLADYGLSSYSDFLVATVTRPDADEAAQQIEAAEAELERTRAMLAAAREVEPASVERTELEAFRTRLVADITDFLGADPGPDVARALASVNDPQFLEVRETLSRLLRMHGVSWEGADSLEAARRFVAEADEARAQRQRSTEELIEIDTRLAGSGGETVGEPWHQALARVKQAQREVDEIRAELQALEPVTSPLQAPVPEDLVPTLLPPPSVLTELEVSARRAAEARQARLAEARDARARAAEPQLQPFRDRLHAAIAVEQRAGAYLHQLEERALELSSSIVDAIEDEEADSVDEALLLPQPELRDIEFAVLGKLSAVRNAYFGGPVPLVFDDAFRAVPSSQRVGLLALVDRLAESTQVIYLSDDAETLVWGERQPAARVAVTSW